MASDISSQPKVELTLKAGMFFKSATLCIFCLLIAAAVFDLSAAPEQKPLLFLGDKDYPPLAYLENGVAKGMDVDLTKALAGPLQREVRVELMDWNLAQEKVLKGEADGLIGLSISDDRRKTYDFAAPTFTRDFGLIVRDNQMTIHDVSDLKGKRVGVTAGGFPRKYFQSQPDIQLVLIDNYEDGFNRLANGTIDAIGADLWVAAYLIEKENVHGVSIVGKPFATTQEALAIPKGNPALLEQINRATESLKADGTVAKIENDWRPQQIVFASRQRIRELLVQSSIAILAVLSAGMALWILTLRRQINVRHKAEAALKESEERFRNLNEAAFEGIGISEDGMILDVNDQMLKMFGYTRDEMLGRKIIGLVAPEWKEKVAESIRLNREEIYGHRLLRKDGSSFFAEARTKMVPAGNRQLRMTALRDVTDRILAEELANTQIQVMEMIVAGRPIADTLNMLLRMIELQSPEMLCSILLLDADGIHVRHAAAPSLPKEYVQAIDGRPIGECAGSCGTAAFRRQPVFVSDIEHDPLWADYKQFALPHGLRACWSTPIFDAQQNVLGTFAIYYRQTGLPQPKHARIIETATHTAAVCITKNRTDAALRESEEKFAKAFRTSPDVMSITDFENGNYLEVNDAHEKTFRFRRDEVIGRSPIEIGIYKNSEGRSEMLQLLKEKGRFSNLEIKALARDGRELTLLHSAELIELGGRLCVLRVSHDVTDRKRAEMEREESILREQQSRIEYTLQLLASQEAERKRIAAELHDSLGQNLLLIKNYAQLLLAKKNVDGELYQQIEAINGLAAQSIAEARNISRDLHPYQLDLVGLTRALEEMIEKANESSGIVFKGKIEDVNNLFSKDNATNLYRIVQESVNNILKHSHAKNARVTLERDVHEAQLSISDDGGGFDPDKGGNGMGLKNIAERTRMLGGKLKLESAHGKGTKIEITIPISVEAE